MNFQTNSPVPAAETFEGGEHDTLMVKASSVGLALEPSPSPANDRGHPCPYARYAEVFSRVYRDTGSIEIALEVVDAFRTRETVLPPVIADVPTLVLKVVAQLFSVKPKLLFGRNRHRDVTSARYVASWLLFRRRWSKSKIASFFDLITRRLFTVCAWSPRTPLCLSRRTRPSSSSHSRATDRVWSDELAS